MELNKASESLYSAKTENHSIEREVGPEPINQQGVVKEFRLERSASRRNHESSDKFSDGPASLQVKEKDEERKESGEHDCGSSMTAASHIDIPVQVLDAQSVGSSNVAVSSVSLQWVEELVISTVESMMISGSGDQQLVEVVLDSTGTVPEAFYGANLTLVQTGTDVSVSFSNFAGDSQLVEAMQLILGNPEQLTVLVNSLQRHQLNLAELVVGNNAVPLPKIEEVQSPLHMIASTIRQEEREQDQGRGDQRQEQQEQMKEEAQV